VIEEIKETAHSMDVPIAGGSIPEPVQEITESVHRKPKIGIFVDAFFPTIDGVIIVVDNLARILSEHFDITVFTAAPAKGNYDDSDRPYKVVRCKSRKIPLVKNIDYDWPNPKGDKDFKKAINESELDMVHIHSPFGVGKMGLRYAKRHNVPTAITMHSQYKRDFLKASKSRLITYFLMKSVARVFNACDEVLAVNHASKEVVRNYGIKKEPIVMENGTDMLPVENKETATKEINEKYSIGADERVILYVGRLVKVKNIFFIAEVLKTLKSKGAEYKMIFVGAGAEKKELHDQIEKYGLTDRVIFAGVVRDRELLAKLYSRADIFVFPSFYDTDGVVKKEAASQKTPMVCAKGSIVAKSVIDGHNAYVAPNDKEGFANAVIDALTDKDKYSKICENAFNDLYITWDDTAKKTHKLYLELVNKAGNK